MSKKKSPQVGSKYKEHKQHVDKLVIYSQCPMSA